MKIEYDYTDAKTGPPKNFEVTVETDEELRAAVGLLLTRELNRSHLNPLVGLETYHLDQAMPERPKYARR